LRVVLQRVREAAVSVDGKVVGQIGPGLLVFVGFGTGDTEEDIRYMADKLLDLRIFNDETQRMNLSLRELKREVLVVSQFTLFGDARKGRRPSFDAAEEPQRAKELYRRCVEYLAEQGFPPQEGIFGAAMDVHLVNDGPVTLLLDSARSF
jgi:D-tyrosyl-tRNA(Tyr) deacylase